MSKGRPSWTDATLSEAWRRTDSVLRDVPPSSTCQQRDSREGLRRGDGAGRRGGSWLGSDQGALVGGGLGGDGEARLQLLGAGAEGLPQPALHVPLAVHPRAVHLQQQPVSQRSPGGGGSAHVDDAVGGEQLERLGLLRGGRRVGGDGPAVVGAAEDHLHGVLAELLARLRHLSHPVSVRVGAARAWRCSEGEGGGVESGWLGETADKVCDSALS